jgi:hypothetical protein
MTSHRAGLATTPLLACGALAGPLFTLTWVVESVTRAGYDPLRHPVSSLELGGGLGWVQQANFVVAGLLSLAFAVGLWHALRPLGGSTWGPLLAGAFAVGLVGAGIFVTDPVSGYPPGTPGRLQAYGSPHAALHDAFSALTFLGLPAACAVLARRFASRRWRGWAIYSAATGTAFLAAFVVTNLAFAQTPGLVAFGGLFQRLCVTIGWTWLTLLAVQMWRAPAARAAAAPPLPVTSPASSPVE